MNIPICHYYHFCNMLLITVIDSNSKESCIEGAVNKII